VIEDCILKDRIDGFITLNPLLNHLLIDKCNSKNFFC